MMPSDDPWTSRDAPYPETMKSSSQAATAAGIHVKLFGRERLSLGTGVDPQRSAHHVSSTARDMQRLKIQCTDRVDENA